MDSSFASNLPFPRGLFLFGFISVALSSLAGMWAGRYHERQQHIIGQLANPDEPTWDLVEDDWDWTGEAEIVDGMICSHSNFRDVEYRYRIRDRASNKLHVVKVAERFYHPDYFGSYYYRYHPHNGSVAIEGVRELKK